MPATAFPEDVSALEELTTLDVRDVVSGIRPVLGATAACALLLIACALFVVDAGSLGPRRDVGKRARVQLQPANLRHYQARTPRAPTRSLRAGVARGANGPPIDHAVRTDDVLAPTVGNESAPAPATSSDVAKGVSAPKAAAAPTAPTPNSTPTTSTPQLPAPPDELPLVPPAPLPAVVPPATPSLPPLTDLPTTTVIGVP